MRYLNAISSVLLAVATGTVAPAYAATSGLALGTCAGAPGERVCVPATLTANGAAVASAGFTVQYNTAAMRLAGGAADVHAGAALSGGQSLAAKVTEDVNGGTGRVQIAITPPPQVPVPAIGDGVLCEVCFTVPAGASCAAPSFVADSVELGSSAGRDVPVVAVSAGSAVGGCAVGPTLASAECRLTALIAATQARGDLGNAKKSLLGQLGRAQSKTEASAQLAAAGKSTAAQKAAQQAIRVLANVERRLQSRSAKRIPDGARAALLGAVGSIRVALTQTAAA